MNPAAVNRPRPGLRLKLWVARLLLLGVSCLLGLLALEFAVRKLLPCYDPSYQVVYRRNEEGLKLGIPFYQTRQGVPKGDFFINIAFNRFGFRDSKDFAHSSTNDIFVVGDSQTFGWGVEESNRFSTLIEKSLRVPAHNLGMFNNDFQGYEELVAFAQRHGAQVRNLIVGVCMQNDLVDYTKEVKGVPLDAAPAAAPKGLKRRLAYWAVQHSALWIGTSWTLQKYDVSRRAFEWMGLANNVEQLTGKNEDDAKVLESSRDELVKLAKPFNTVILIIPSRGLWYGNYRAVEEKVHTRFVELIRAAGLKVVDMKPVFEAAGNPQNCYYAHDPHWTVRAHGLAAKALVEALRSDPDWKFLDFYGF